MADVPTYDQIDPSTLTISTTGRGAWTSLGFKFTVKPNYLWRRNDTSADEPQIGTDAGSSLSRWAICAGSGAIQRQLAHLGYATKAELLNFTGLWGPVTDNAFRTFQSSHVDPADGRPLTVDGRFGRQDSRAMFTPMIDAAQQQYGIPNRYLRGLLNAESMLDPGAVGYYIFYQNPDGSSRYGGVDRGLAQINSKSNPQVSWQQAYDAEFSVDWAAARLKNAFDDLKAEFPAQDQSILWLAAILNHNNPSAARSYARTGNVPNADAATYINHVLTARY